MECIRLHEEIVGSPSADSETGTCGAAQTAKDARVKKLVLSHQTVWLEDPASKTQAIGEVMSIFSGPTIWGEELLEVPWR